jgi:hypothetical protein
MGPSTPRRTIPFAQAVSVVADAPRAVRAGPRRLAPYRDRPERAASPIAWSRRGDRAPGTGASETGAGAVRRMRKDKRLDGPSETKAHLAVLFGVRTRARRTGARCIKRAVWEPSVIQETGHSFPRVPDRNATQSLTRGTYQSGLRP